MFAFFFNEKRLFVSYFTCHFIPLCLRLPNIPFILQGTCHEFDIYISNLRINLPINWMASKWFFFLSVRSRINQTDNL
jgi:hypothetical protein